MDTSNITGPQLLIKYIDGDITPEELVLLEKCIEKSPELKEMLEKLSDKDNLWDRFFYQHEIDTNEAWEDFKSEHFAEHHSKNGSETKRENYEYTQNTGIKIIWGKTMLIAAAFVLIVGGVTYTVVNIISNSRAEVAEVQSERNVFVTGPVAKFIAGGYWDLADIGRFNLKDLHQDRIDLAGSIILNQGAMFTIENNEVEGIKARTIKLVTADNQVKLQLPDGSRVTLNENSSIEFSLPFNNGQRTVSVWGEAYFEVESNPDIPFVVQLNNKVTVQAYGTIFTVNSSEKDCFTTLLRGHVTVTNDEQTKTLKEGEQVQIIEGDQPFKVTQTDPEKAIAWTRKNGFEYRNIEFKQMMREIGMWYGYSVEFKGEIPRRIIENIKLNEDVHLTSLVEDIEKDDQVEIEITNDKKLVVTGK